MERPKARGRKSKQSNGLRKSKTPQSKPKKQARKESTLEFSTLDSKPPVSTSSANKKSVQVSTSTSIKPSTQQKITSTLLGFPGGILEPEKDVDPYVTKIGGLPTWFSQENDKPSPPSHAVSVCGNCAREMYLLFQAYAPLGCSPYDRIVYVWACNQQKCMRRSGSFRAIRALRLNKEYAQQEKKKREKAIIQPTSNSDELLSVNLSSSWPTISETIGTEKGAAGKSEGNTLVDNIVSQNGDILPSSSDTSTKCWSDVASVGDLSDRLEKLKFDARTSTLKDQAPFKPWPEEILFFRGQYLYITEEVLEGPSLEKYDFHLKMQKEDHFQGDEENGEWTSEKYEKAMLPKGVDKTFMRFSERVAEWPEQCVRYEFGGQPLLYNQSDATAALLMGNTSSPYSQLFRCPNCGGARVFEFQLMPNILCTLSTSSYTFPQDKLINVDDVRGKNVVGGGINQFDLGMEWGTLMVFSCKDDCNIKRIVGDSAANDCHVAYYEELVLVQYEE